MMTSTATGRVRIEPPSATNHQPPTTNRRMIYTPRHENPSGAAGTRRPLGRARPRASLVCAVREHAADKAVGRDRKSTRLNSSHLVISYAVFCLQKETMSRVVTACAQD